MSMQLASKGPMMPYDEAVRTTWAPLRPDGGLNEVVRYATLAANSHNTQPWRFMVEEKRITIAPDFSRRCPAVDPDDHHPVCRPGLCRGEHGARCGRGGPEGHSCIRGECRALHPTQRQSRHS